MTNIKKCREKCKVYIEWIELNWITLQPNSSVHLRMCEIMTKYAGSSSVTQSDQHTRNVAQTDWMCQLNNIDTRA